MRWKCYKKRSVLFTLFIETIVVILIILTATNHPQLGALYTRPEDTRTLLQCLSSSCQRRSVTVSFALLNSCSHSSDIDEMANKSRAKRARSLWESYRDSQYAIASSQPASSSCSQSVEMYCSYKSAAETGASIRIRLCSR